MSPGRCGVVVENLYCLEGDGNLERWKGKTMSDATEPDVRFVLRLFYWNGSIPGHKDVGPCLKEGDKVEFKGRVWKVDYIIADFGDEQRIAVV